MGDPLSITEVDIDPRQSSSTIWLGVDRRPQNIIYTMLKYSDKKNRFVGTIIKVTTNLKNLQDTFILL